MTIIKAMAIACAMYSKIPMPKVEWNEKNMRYALCFFPLVGFLEGAAFFAAFCLMRFIHVPELMRAAVFCTLPILITGGIHMDGFLDTMDALSSYQTRERKLEILKDSHTGAFAIIGCAVYMVLYLGGVSGLEDSRSCLMVCTGFVISRSLSGLSLVLFKGARKNGLAYTFSSSAHKTVTRAVLAAILLISVCLAVSLDGAAGLVMVTGAAIVFIYYRLMSYKEFGGITGDLAGFFLQVCELVTLYGVVIAEGLKSL